MTETDAEIARKIMYDEKTPSNPKRVKEIKVQKAPKSVIVESDGIRHQIPSMAEFIKLTREYEKTRNESRKLKIDVKILTETIKTMGVALRSVEQELLNKADKYDSN